MPRIIEISDKVETRFIDLDKVCSMIRRETSTSLSLTIRFEGEQEMQFGTMERVAIDRIVEAYREYMNTVNELLSREYDVGQQEVDEPPHLPTLD